MARRGKRYRELYGRIDRERQYPPSEAIELVKGLQSSKFPETVECHIRTGLNVRHADEQLRGTITLPHSAGRDVTVIAFAKGEKARDAEAAGADAVGDDDLAKRIQDGWTDFDVAVATPDMMPVVGRLGRILGPQGKMPNPKVGTVTDDVERAVTEAKAGRTEYRTDRSAIVHMPIGKTDLEARELLENYAALIDEIVRAKPAAAKGRYLRTITLATTHGPGIRVDPTRTRDIVADEGAAANGAGADAGGAGAEENGAGAETTGAGSGAEDAGDDEA
ncbi:MAG: 50S ribosomal protein L1 [Actinobacteria bacterium]|nr:50S ribosomal protein L1 [Actinomycetota bacterium]